MNAFLYVLRYNGGKYYVGSTVDLERRMKEHAVGRGCAFTKAHLPFELVYTEEHPSYESAYERERQVHKWSRAKKERLIKGELPYKGQLNLGSRGTRMTTTVETRVCELQSGSRAESRDNSDNTRRWFLSEVEGECRRDQGQDCFSVPEELEGGVYPERSCKPRAEMSLLNLCRGAAEGRAKLNELKGIENIAKQTPHAPNRISAI